MKVDLHVHSEYSEYITLTTGFITMLGAKECYNKLEDIYRVAKSRGMGCVAITDHDTIEGALILNDKYPDIIIGEELEVKAFNLGHLIHLVALDINENIHRDLVDLKKIGIKETADYLKKRDIFYFIAHISHSASAVPLNPKLIDRLMRYVDTLEVSNIETNIEENALMSIMADIYGKNRVAGSDAHILDFIGRSFTVSDKAKTKQEFIQALKHGDCYVKRCQGSNYRQFTKQTFVFIYNIYKEAIFYSKQKKRPRIQKYFLDYLLLAALVLPIAAYFPPFLYSMNYQRKNARQAQKLRKEFFKFFVEKYE